MLTRYIWRLTRKRQGWASLADVSGDEGKEKGCRTCPLVVGNVHQKRCIGSSEDDVSVPLKASHVRGLSHST